MARREGASRPWPGSLRRMRPDSTALRSVLMCSNPSLHRCTRFERNAPRNPVNGRGRDVGERVTYADRLEPDAVEQRPAHRTARTVGELVESTSIAQALEGPG